jgi:nitrogen regulatory protein P-II 1
MYLLIIILHREEWLDDVLSGLVELGIEDAITIDSESMERALAAKVPIFAGLRFDLRGRPYSKTILAVADTPEVGMELISMLKEVNIDLEAEGASRIITLKIESIFGTPREIEEI